jgi:glutamine synthetase
MKLMPDLNTFKLLPWGGVRVICSAVTPQGDPFIGDPRNALVTVLEEAASMGFQFQSSMELEFFLFKTNAQGDPLPCQPIDDATYYDLPGERGLNLQQAMGAALLALDIPVLDAHAEIAQGQYEVAFDHDDALRSADALITARVALRTVAAQSGAYCTFMPRPCQNMAGSGLHTHQSLHSDRDGLNVFVDTGDQYGLSEIGRQFLAGQLYHARAMTALLAPLVNSYKRLGQSFEAPIYISWAHVNRSALIRVPVIASNGGQTRLELRCPDPSTNPYLALAVMLKAGLDGIKHQMVLSDPLEETLLQKRSRMRTMATLPATLGEALRALRDDDVILDALGAYIGDRFLESKQKEYDDYSQIVTQWELERYLHNI